MKKTTIIVYTMAVLLVGGFLGHLIKESEASKYCGRCVGDGVNCDLKIINATTLRVRVYNPNKITRVFKDNYNDAMIYIAK